MFDLSAVRMPSNIRSKVASASDRMIREPDRDLLEDAQHRALADRAVLALERVVLRQVLDRQLEQRILVGNERIAVNEVIAIPEVLAVGLSHPQSRTAFFRLFDSRW